MGGRIWVESEAGQGQHVSLHGPLRAIATSPARGRLAASWQLARGLTVLVVDDNATNRRILQEMLTNWGMRPTVVDSGARRSRAAQAARRRRRTVRPGAARLP